MFIPSIKHSPYDYMSIRDATTIWNQCLKVIRQEVDDEQFKTWFSPIVPLHLEGNTLTIQVPSLFFYEWIEEHYVHALRKAIVQVLGKGGRLDYSVIVDRGDASHHPLAMNISTAKANNGDRGKLQEKQTAPVREQEGGSASLRPKRKAKKIPDEYRALLEETELNSHYTFENFVEGDCNRLARSAAFAVAQKPGVTSFNPLMIYGGVGLGKTHLVQAIGNYIRKTQEEKIVVYVSSEKFTSQFIEELKNNNLQFLTNFYLLIDVLIIDDVQFLAGKEKTQELFFHVFNHLHQKGKQIVMTSDRPPRELKGLQDRLLSRFKWGLTADLQQPDFETRLAIIQRKLQNEGISLDAEVIEYLANTIDSNIRELEGVIVSLMAHSSLNRRPIDMALAKEVVQRVVQKQDELPHEDIEVGIDTIMEEVARYFGLSVEALKSKSRKKEIVVPRQIAMYLCKEYTNFSLKSIGYHFGGRDHSTVIHAVQNISELREKDADFRLYIDQLLDRLRMLKQS